MGFRKIDGASGEEMGIQESRWGFRREDGASGEGMGLQQSKLGSVNK